MMNSADFEILKQLIEASPSELNLVNTNNNEFLEHFKLARRSYFLNDIDGIKGELQYFLKDHASKSYSKICALIFELRTLIREMKFTDDKIDLIHSSDSFFNLDIDNVEKVLLIELLAVEAICCDLIQNHNLCYTKNMKAAQFADDMELKKKASTLNYNGIVALKHKTPANLRICYLVEASNKAKLADDFNTQIAALTSLAQEYETLDCYNLAYDECYKAFVLAQKHSFGTYNFCYVSLICARLAIHSGRLDLASEKLKIVDLFSFSELNDQIQKTKALLANRQESEGLSGDEQKLIWLLTSGPKHKYELIEKIYGQGDMESLDNRLKQLFLRLRKKKNGLISFNRKESLYELIH